MAQWIDLLANAGDMELISGLGRPHAGEQLILWATATEPLTLEPTNTTTEAHVPGACALQQREALP